MPFLCVFQKTSARGWPADPVTLQPVDPGRVNTAFLPKLLCPYGGDYRSVDLERGIIHVSTLVDTDIKDAPGTVLRAPRGTRKNAQTAWLEVTRTDEAVRFETDPLGTFPLFVFEDDFRLAVTSEVKCLAALGCVDNTFRPDAFAEARRPPDFSPYANVRRVYPGAVLEISRDLQWREVRRDALVYRPEHFLQSPEEQAQALEAALLASARSIGAASGDWGAFVSGGIDSSVATCLLSRLQPTLATFTLGTKLGDEYAEAEELAKFLGAKHTRVFASEDDAEKHFTQATFSNETVDGLTGETLAQLGILAKVASESVTRVITGYGADLLFGSMLRHELYMKVTGVDDLQSLVERTCWSAEFCPFYAWALGIEVHHLFWDPDVMNTAFRIPPAASFDGTHEKIVLRKLAEDRGWMRHEHAWRTKKALTDGTQFNRVLSNALYIPETYAYDRKSTRCISVLEHILVKGAFL